MEPRKKATLKMAEAIRESQKKNAMAGKSHSVAPLGYRITKRDGEKTLVINEYEIEIIREIFNLYASGEAVVNIPDLILQKFDIWIGTSSISIILNNRFYAGFVKFSNEFYPHYYPCAITIQLFEKCQNKLKENGIRKAHKGGKNIFTGFIKCYLCNDTLYYKAHHTTELIYEWYACNRSTKKHSAVSIRIDDLKRQFSQILYKFRLASGNIVKSKSKTIAFIEIVIKEMILNGKELQYSIKENIDANLFKSTFGVDLIYAPITKILIDDPILKECAEPKSFEELLKIFNTDSNNLNSKLFDLQLEDLIEQDGIGRWITK